MRPAALIMRKRSRRMMWLFLQRTGAADHAEQPAVVFDFTGKDAFAPAKAMGFGLT